MAPSGVLVAPSYGLVAAVRRQVALWDPLERCLHHLRCWVRAHASWLAASELPAPGHVVALPWDPVEL